ncbi:MAG: isopenicillin N synthase family oxygenase [Proteobacteria bacterium]|nr:isopenicillin N synthase family oxygenase [Pseudomonadota bacterium]MDA1064401.1 isopenicillin N synthase family oxygenase [Pseudomonadota bacterium]
MNVRSLDFRGADAGKQFALSLHETGFAVLRNHPVSAAMLDRMREEWRAFFSDDGRYKFVVSGEHDAGDRAGYFPLDLAETAIGHTAKDLKEFYHVIADFPIPPACSATTLEYRRLTFDLGSSLCEWLQQHTPAATTALLSEPFPSMLDFDASVLRILHYPPMDGSEAPETMRAAPHEDINLLTILPAANQPGLEVKDNAGNWHAVPCDPGTIVVNSGDMLQEATGGYYPSTTHRVVNPGGDIENVSRISIPFFLTARLAAVLSERYTAGEYLDERLRMIYRGQ